MRSFACMLFYLFHTSQAAPFIGRASSPNQLILADTGVGHRSLPVTEWRTSLRRISTDGNAPSTVIQWGKSPPAEPIGATSVTVDRKTQNIYITTGNGIARTAFDGSKNAIIIPDVATFAVLSEDKIYYGIMTDGLIKRANLDGSDQEIYLNVSNGLNFSYTEYTPSYIPPNSYPDGVAIDEQNSLLYWSSSTTDSSNVDNGSIRRVPLKSQGTAVPADVEILVENIQMPGQLRLMNNTLYWVEKGRWSDSPTYIRRATFPTEPISKPISQEQLDTIVNSKSSLIFTETDVVGEKQVLSIESFTLDEKSGTLWFTMQSSARTMFAKLVQTRMNGGNLKVLNANVTDIGIPMGIAYLN